MPQVKPGNRWVLKDKTDIKVHPKIVCTGLHNYNILQHPSILL